jgi:Cu/Ag efflux pump CusA
MMRSIVGWSLQLRLPLVAAAVVLIVFGVTELRKMPLEAVPEFSRPYVEVQTEALGLSASEVEAMVTVPLEADLLNGVPWVERIRSESITGLSSIVMEFEAGTDLLVARQMVQERLTGLYALPLLSSPPRMLQPVSSTRRIMKIGLTSESLMDLSVVARWTIVPRLMGVPGVANVSIWGQRERQLQVQVDPKKLQEERVTLNQVIESTGNALWVSPLTYLDASCPGTGGWVETPNQRLGIQHIPSISTSADLAQVTVAGSIKRLGDLARVVEDHQPLIGDALIDDVPALMLVVEKLPGANTQEVTHAVEDAVAALKLGLPGVTMDTSLFRPATYLELAGGNLGKASVIGAALLAVSLLGLFLNWRTALVGILTILLSCLGAVGVLHLRGTSINLMLIAGLTVALTILVDDAILGVHGIVRRLRERRNAGDDSTTGRVIAEAVMETRSPLFYAILILLLAIAPVFFMGGAAGVFSQEVAISYAIALLVSTVIALTLAPTLSFILLRNAALGEGDSPLLSSVRNGLFGAAAPRAGGVAMLAPVVGAALLAGLLFLPHTGQSVIPELRERDVIVELEGAPGTSEDGMSRILSRATRELRAIPGVRKVSGHVGRAIMSDRVDNVDSGELWVSLDASADYDATLSSIRGTVAGYPGFDVDVDTYLSEQMREDAGASGNGGTNGDSELVVRVYGLEPEMIRRKAEEVRQVVSRVEGVHEAQVELPAEQPTLEIEVDIARASQYGLKPGEVRRAATTLLAGIGVGSLFEQQKVFGVVVWSTPEVRRNVSDVEGLLIDTPSGSQVRLKDVADVHIVSTAEVINRETVAQYVDVTADVSGRSFSAVVAEVEQSLEKDVKFPLEYRAEVMGDFAEQAAMRARVRAVALAAAITILLLLQAAFGNWRLASFVFLSLPAAALGGVLIALAGGDLMSLGSMFGLFAVVGIAARNVLTLISHYRDLERRQGQEDTAELVQRGTAERFVPIMTTAIAVAAVMLPFALLGNDAGLEILQPMAVVILGGLVTATFVSLTVVPALYVRFGAGRDTLDLT